MKKGYRNNMNVIKGTFLSNFWECDVVYNDMKYRNSESAFQAQKCANSSDKYKFIALSGAEAKAMGKRVDLREDWNDVRLDVMYQVLQAKFAQNPDLYQQLKDTGSEEIIETNWWYDKYWGVCNGVGENHLGKLLMWIRDNE
jgi:ribA/ribD-fused uncharacterized protein